jgi:hypothetical protein
MYLPCNFQIIEHSTLPEDTTYSPTLELEAENVIFATDIEIPVIGGRV